MTLPRVSSGKPRLRRDRITRLQNCKEETEQRVSGEKNLSWTMVCRDGGVGVSLFSPGLTPAEREDSGREVDGSLTPQLL